MTSNSDSGVRREMASERPAAATSLAGSIISAMRLHQWSKNFLIFVPLIISHEFDLADIRDAAIAFFSFSLVASATYIFNDILDREVDELHETKRLRPFASGDLQPSTGWFVIAALILLGAGLAALLPIAFGMVLAAYVVASVAYTLRLKRMLGLDIVVIACLYVLRVIAGDEAIGAQFEGLDSSDWILAFSCLLFLSLATVKRCSELARLENGPQQRLLGRSYTVGDYPVMLAIAAAAGLSSMAILMRFIGSPDVTQNFSQPRILWVIVPLLIFWLIRMLLLANRGKIHTDPVVYTLRDPMSQLCGIGVFLVSLLAW